MRRIPFILFTALFAGPAGAQHAPAVKPVRADLVVYGATPSGICAALAAQQEGSGVILYAPGGHVGGMLTSGLSSEHLKKQPLLGGLTRTVFERIAAEYGAPFDGHFEPKVAARVIDGMLGEAGITVIRGKRIQRAYLKDTRITGFVSEGGAAIAGTVFIDASYEGDLMERAGVTYTYGRESRSTYGEEHAGAMAKHPEFDQWDVTINATARAPGVSTHPPTPLGKGDTLLPGYSYRPVITVQAGNKNALAAPEGYREDTFRILGLYLSRKPGIKLTELFEFVPLGEGKYELGPRGPFSTVMLDGNRHYPDLNTERRQDMAREHRRYTEGLLHFLASGKAVPEALRKDMSKFGYARDEFVANGNFPPQLHVVEARRMVGRHVLIEQDVLEQRSKVDAVGVGFYPIDCGHVVRTFDESRKVYNYGGVRLEPGKPFQVPYRCLTPMEFECTNLLLSVCISASHIAYGSINREPQLMIFGESAGVAAAMAVKEGTAVQDVDITTLQQRLTARKQIISIQPLASGQPENAAAPGN